VARAGIDYLVMTIETVAPEAGIRPMVHRWLEIFWATYLASFASVFWSHSNSDGNARPLFDGTPHHCAEFNQISDTSDIRESFDN